MTSCRRGEQWVWGGGGCGGYERLGDGAAWDERCWLGGKPADAERWVSAVQITRDDVKPRRAARVEVREKVNAAADRR